MARVREGDREAFNLLFRQWEGRLRGLFTKCGCPYHEAQDLIQETFLRLWLARDSYEPTGTFAGYLFTIARNCLLAHLRRDRCRPREAASDGTEDSADRLLSDGDRAARSAPVPEESLMLEYRKWRIRRAVQSIPEPHRSAFVLVHLRGMKYTEVAEKMGTPVGTVKSRINTALGILRERLKEETL